MTKDEGNHGFRAALLALVVLQLVMLSALFAGVAPHPPEATPLFGIAPFLGMSVAAAVASAMIGAGAGVGRALGLGAALMAAVSFGPHKYFDPQFPLIWPAVLAGQVAIVSVFVIVFKRGASLAKSAAL